MEMERSSVSPAVNNTNLPELTCPNYTGYVGYDPTLETVIVAHQGTDPSEL